MGRRRKTETGLPPNWVLHHGAYYFRVPASQRDRWGGMTKVRLGKTLQEAFTAWYERAPASVVPVTFADAVKRYRAEILPKLAPRTQVDYTIALGLLLDHFKAMDPAKIKPVDIYRYMDGRPRVRGNREKAV